MQRNYVRSRQLTPAYVQVKICAIMLQIMTHLLNTWFQYSATQTLTKFHILSESFIIIKFTLNF